MRPSTRRHQNSVWQVRRRCLLVALATSRDQQNVVTLLVECICVKSGSLCTSQCADSHKHCWHSITWRV